MSRKAYIDSKFDVILEHLLDRDFERVDSPEECLNDADLVWTNLRNITWNSIVNQTVNHLKGSHHLSNKSFLAYHISCSERESLMPLQWSAAYQDLGELISMALYCDLYRLALRISTTTTGPPLSTQEVNVYLKKYGRLIAVLRLDTDWAASTYASLIQALMEVLRQYVDDESYAHAAIVLLLSQHKELQHFDPMYVDIGSNDDNSDNGSNAQPFKDESVWIVKPVGSSCGAGISLCRGLKDLLHSVIGVSYKCVVQKYIERPLLVRDRRKFDIRQWILVTSGNEPIEVYGCSEFYCRLSKTSYTTNDDKLSDIFVHLCNHAIQEMKEEDTDNGSSSSGDGEIPPLCDSMMSHQELQRELTRQGHPPDIVSQVIMPQIRTISLQIISSVRDKLQKVGDGFEWLGLDLVVTEDLLVKLIECNVSPDVSRSTPVTSRLVEQGVASLLPLLLDGDKEMAVSDTEDGVCWQRWWSSDSVESSTSESSKATELSQLSVLQFANAKRRRRILGTDYAPRKVELVERCNIVLKAVEKSDSNEKEEDSSDEL